MTQTTDAALVDQTRLLHMGPNVDGSWGMELEGGPIPAIAEYLANMLGMRTDTPSNYVQMEVNRADLGAMVLTLQRLTGKTPHQLRVEAEDKAAAAADTIEAQARRIEALEGALRPMSEAPRDRFILAMYRSVDGHRAHMDGRVFTVRHEGKTVSDFDLGWALYPGYGGVPDVSFYGWMDMPAALTKAPTP